MENEMEEAGGGPEDQVFDQIGDEIEAMARSMGPEWVLQVLQRIRSEVDAKASQQQQPGRQPQPPGPGAGPGGAGAPDDPMMMALMGKMR